MQGQDFIEITAARRFAAATQERLDNTSTIATTNLAINLAVVPIYSTDCMHRSHEAMASMIAAQKYRSSRCSLRKRWKPRSL